MKVKTVHPHDECTPLNCVIQNLINNLLMNVYNLVVVSRHCRKTTVVIFIRDIRKPNET